MVAAAVVTDIAREKAKRGKHKRKCVKIKWESNRFRINNRDATDLGVLEKQS